MSEPAKDVIGRRTWPTDRQWRIAALAAALIMAIVAAGWLVGRLLAPPASAPAASTPPGTFRPTPQQLKTLTVEPVSMHGFVTEELTEGKVAVNGDHATAVFSPYSGRVTRVLRGPGDTVRAGAPLALLEASEYVQAQNDLKSADAQVKLARSNEARKHALLEAKGGSQQDWQAAQADLTTAESALGAARNRLRIFGKSADEIDALQAAGVIDPVAKLTAPIAGVVVDRQVGPGQFVQAGGGTPLFTISDPSSVWLLANVREADAGLIKPGQAVEVRVPAYPKAVFKATLTYVSAMVDPGTHRLPVRAEMDNRDGALKPEMFASFRILSGAPSQSPAVPENAVVYEGDAAHVWVLGRDGLLSYKPIHPGRSDAGLIEVLDGLKAGDLVVTRGALFIDQAATPAST